MAGHLRLRFRVHAKPEAVGRLWSNCTRPARARLKFDQELALSSVDCCSAPAEGVADIQKRTEEIF